MIQIYYLMACQVFTLLNEMVLDKFSMLFSVMDALKECFSIAAQIFCILF